MLVAIFFALVCLLWLFLFMALRWLDYCLLLKLDHSEAISHLPPFAFYLFQMPLKAENTDT
jgi:hypothetical protein